MTTTTPSHRPFPAWPRRAAVALSFFLIASGLVMMLLPQLGDQFLGMSDPAGSRARSAMVGIRQMEYGILLLVLLRAGAHHAAGLAIRVGGLIPLVDACIAYTQTGLYTAAPHFAAAVGAQVISYAMLKAENPSRHRAGGAGSSAAAGPDGLTRSAE